MAEQNTQVQELKPRSSTSAATEPKDNFREIIETVVFVIVLVLLLKSFVAEAFVIPTGSMAETLYGYQKIVNCPKCQFTFPVNCSGEVDPPKRELPSKVESCTCPNCRYHIRFGPATNADGSPTGRDGIDPKPETGDRVLVDKSLYDLMTEPERYDVVVFKFPDNPQQDHVQMNYIKRLVGKPGDTIAVYYGDLYMTQDLKYEGRPAPESPERARKAVYDDDEEAVNLFKEQRDNQFLKKINGMGFEIVRKDPDKILALRRIVYNNDFQAKDLVGEQPPRWAAEREATWTPDKPDEPGRFTSGSGGNLSWLNYRHILRSPVYRISDASLQALLDDGFPANLVERMQPLRSNNLLTADKLIEELQRFLPADEVTKHKTKILTHTVAPALITDFMGYNTGKGQINERNENWVGDLMLECEVMVQEPTGDLILDLAKGADRFQARWDLATGNCTLVRLSRVDGQLKEEILGAEKTPTELKKKGTYRLRFANFDERLTVWVDSSLPFGHGVKYNPPKDRGPYDNDLLPVRIGTTASGVIVDHLKVWRDSYYTVARHNPGNADADLPLGFSWRNPEEWNALRNLPLRTMYVQPGHYLCMGDNSPESSDGRNWGLVPRRLMLGRALLVYWPYNRAGPIR